MDRVAMLSVHGCPLAHPGTPGAGGMQMYIKALGRELGRRGLAVDVFTRRTAPGLPEIVPFGPNARVIHLSAGEPAPVPKDEVFDLLPEFVCNLQRFRRAEGVDYQIVHSHYWLSGWVGHLLARRWGVPHVTMFHTLGQLKNRALGERTESATRIEVEERIAGAADVIVASSEHERTALVELYRAPWERIAVVPGGVDLCLFQPRDRHASRAVLGIDGEVVLFVGRMDPVKGLDILLRAVGLLADRRNLRLVIVGGDGQEEERRRAETLAASLGIAARFVPAVRQEDLPLYYSAADVLVVPSYYESFGLVAVEALACGTPVIAARVGGLPTIIRDGENGLLVPWRHPAAFAERIARLLDEHELRIAMAARARASVAGFSWERVADQVIAIYQRLSAAGTERDRVYTREACYHRGSCL